MLTGVINSLKYVISMSVKAPLTVVKAGLNNPTYRIVGGVIVGATVGSVVPIVGTIIGAFVGGIIMMGKNYHQSG